MKLKDLIIDAEYGDKEAIKQLNAMKSKQSPTVRFPTLKHDGLTFVAPTTSNSDNQSLNNLFHRLKQWLKDNNYPYVPKSKVMERGKVLSKLEFMEIKRTLGSKVKEV